MLTLIENGCVACAVVTTCLPLRHKAAFKSSHHSTSNDCSPRMPWLKHFNGLLRRLRGFVSRLCCVHWWWRLVEVPLKLLIQMIRLPETAHLITVSEEPYIGARPVKSSAQAVASALTNSIPDTVLPFARIASTWSSTRAMTSAVTGPKIALISSADMTRNPLSIPGAVSRDWCHRLAKYIPVASESGSPGRGTLISSCASSLKLRFTYSSKYFKAMFHVFGFFSRISGSEW